MCGDLWEALESSGEFWGASVLLGSSEEQREAVGISGELWGALRSSAELWGALKLWRALGSSGEL